MPELKKDKYTIEKAEPKTDKEKEQQLPVYMEQISLSAEQKQRLSDEIFEERDAILEEYRTSDNIYDRFDSLDNQYKGKLRPNPGQQFNLHRHTTKVKCDTIERYIGKAFFESDPKISVTPRPEYAKEGGTEVCEQQQEYLDYQIDEGNIPLEEAWRKAAHHAVLKYGGIIRIDHELEKEVRRREETYKGNPVYTVILDNVQVEIPKDDYDQLPIKPDIVAIKNDGLEDFLRAYPTAMDDYPGYVRQLEEGKEINIVVNYEEVVINDPITRSVNPKNFIVRKDVEGYNGLKNTKLIIEKEQFLWWDLKREEKAGKFYDIDDLMFQYESKGKSKIKTSELVKGYKNKNFTVNRCTYYFKLNPEDEEETKIICWVEEESRRVIGAILYPYYAIPINYVPLFIRRIDDGFWQQGVGPDLTDSNIAENAILNHTLEAMWMRNMITPIVKEGSRIAEQFLEKSWTHGIPLEVEEGEKFDTLQKYMAQIDANGLLTLMSFIVRGEDDVSGVSSYMSGRESPLDPEAPAKKTIALLKQSGISIEDYIKALLPSFNLLATMILQMTYQMTKEAKPYTSKSKLKSVGSEEAFKELPRYVMAARTNIQSQAMAFNFDKLNEKAEDLALYQTLRQEPLIARNPQAVYFILKALIKNWSPKWKNRFDDILPSLDQLKQEQLQVASQAVLQYMEAKSEESKVTGEPLQFDPEEVLASMEQAQMSIATPVEEQ